jgi:NADH:ubiquinone oxidoreductase subunit C
MIKRLIEVKPEDLKMTLEHLKAEGFIYFSFLTAVDTLKTFVLFYRLVNPETGNCAMVRTEIDRENPEIESVIELYKGANWHEREVYDLFGITFKGHPELRRILLYEGFEGYPLRKDWSNPEIEKRPGDFV